MSREEARKATVDDLITSLRKQSVQPERDNADVGVKMSRPDEPERVPTSAVGRRAQVWLLNCPRRRFLASVSGLGYHFRLTRAC